MLNLSYQIGKAVDSIEDDPEAVADTVRRALQMRGWRSGD